MWLAWKQFTYYLHIIEILKPELPFMLNIFSIVNNLFLVPYSKGYCFLHGRIKEIKESTISGPNLTLHTPTNRPYRVWQVTGTVKEFTERRERCRERIFILLSPKGKALCTADKYRGKNKKAASSFKG